MKIDYFILCIAGMLTLPLAVYFIVMLDKKYRPRRKVKLFYAPSKMLSDGFVLFEGSCTQNVHDILLTNGSIVEGCLPVLSQRVFVKLGGSSLEDIPFRRVKGIRLTGNGGEE